MIPGYEKIVEERILTAQKNGDFDNLEGSGKPIQYEDETGIPEDLRLSYKILKNAGCVPPELETSREIRKTEDLLQNEKETEKTYRLMKKLRVLMRKRKIETPVFETLPVIEEYQANLLNRISKKSEPLSDKEMNSY